MMWTAGKRLVASSNLGGVCLAALLLTAATSAHANNVAGGVIIGVFSNVITSGDLLNYPTINQDSFYDNAGTSVYSITNSADTTLASTPPLQATGSKLQWGTYPPGFGIDPDNSFSELEFFGAQVPANIHEPFLAGRITYLNGTSTLTSQIFGAELSFYVNSVSPLNYLGTDTVYINTTENYNQSISQDADWINICGNGSNICSSRVEAFEDSEGGTGVTANLMGDIVGDPQLVLTSVALAPGQSTTTNGFIGSGPELSVPEPSSMLALVAGLTGIGLIRHFARRGGRNEWTDTVAHDATTPTAS